MQLPSVRFGKIILDPSVPQTLNWWQTRRLNHAIASVRPQMLSLEQHDIHLKVTASKTWPHGGFTTGICYTDCEGTRSTETADGTFSNYPRLNLSSPYLMVRPVSSNGEPTQYPGTDGSTMNISKVGAGKKQNWNQLLSLAIAEALEVLYYRNQKK